MVVGGIGRGVVRILIVDGVDVYGYLVLPLLHDTHSQDHVLCYLFALVYKRKYITITTLIDVM